MKRTVLGVSALAAALAVSVSACSSSGGNAAGSSTPPPDTAGSSSTSSSSVPAPSGAGKTITVWLQSDAQTGWPSVVAQANARFEQATGAKVKIQWQEWSNYTQKLDSTFSGSSGIPDVVELGNTQTASYIDAGAFKALDKSEFDNSSTWLTALEQSASSPDGQLMAVPYYAGSRVVIYRTDIWKAAGITIAPKTLDELNADLDKIKAKNPSPNFSAFYMPGKYWYAAMSLVYGAGGRIADQHNGKWVGELESPAAQRGLAEWQKLATQYSVGGATSDESTQDVEMAKGNIASIAGNGWEVGAVADPKTGDPKLAKKLSTFPFPGNTAGNYTPSFLGGSDLAVPEKAPNADLGAEWIKYYTDTKSETLLAKYAIPNTTSLLGVYEKQSQANRSTGEAAKKTWFVPNTATWANVEANNILQNMLESIATGHSTIAAATKAADQKLDQTLNGVS